MNKFPSSSFDVCFEDNGFTARQVINIDFDSDKLCDKYDQLNEAINSFAANYACDRRGTLFRKITRAARKAKDFFTKKQRQMEARSTPLCPPQDCYAIFTMEAYEKYDDAAKECQNIGAAVFYARNSEEYDQFLETEDRENVWYGM